MTAFGESARAPGGSPERGDLQTEHLSAPECAKQVLDQAVSAVDSRGRFVIVVAGGRTPRPVYRELERLGEELGVDWGRWTVLMSDERFLPTGHEDRNFTMLRRVMPSLAAAGRIVPMLVEETPEVAAMRYSTAVREVGHIDLAVLGLGSDGHTASLFPRRVEDRVSRVVEHEEQPCFVVRGAPGPAPVRISLSANVLSSAGQVWFLVDQTDREKEWAVGELLHGGAIRANDVRARRRRVIALQSSSREEAGE